MNDETAHEDRSRRRDDPPPAAAQPEGTAPHGGDARRDLEAQGEQPAALTLSLFLEVWGLLTSRDRRRIAVYVLGSFVASLSEVIGLAVLLPLVQLMTGGSMTDGFMGTIHGWLGEPERPAFAAMLAAGMVCAFAAKAVLGLGMNWWGGGFTAGLQVDLQSRLLRAFLTESFAAHRQRNTSHVVRATGQAVVDTFGKVLGGALTLLSDALSLAVMVALLVMVMPIPTLVAVAYLGLSMFIIDRLLASRTQAASGRYLSRVFDASKALLESFQGFREIRMLNKEDLFIERFTTASWEAAQAARRIGFYQAIPKYALEIVAIIGIATLIAVLTVTDSGSAIASLALFVAAAIRMLPTVTRLTATVGMMRSGAAGTQMTLATVRELDDALKQATSLPPALPAPARGDISVRDVVYQFADAGEPVLRGVTLDIPQGASIAVCGTSGSGKTTLVDVILGLQTPQSGCVTYAGIDIRQLRENWRSRVGYIPQDVFLLDDSLAENIAYGDRGPTRDDARIHECIRLAQLEGLVEEMPQGIFTQIGERGTRLSGGQRQRVGIARALYHRPSVIVMDEATSALDNETESQIINTVQSLRGELTTIMVAHRLSTVRDVDLLVFIEEGRVTARGTFDEVRATSPQFAELVRLGDLGLTP